MTEEQFKKLPFKAMSHLSMREEHATTYKNKQFGICMCVHVPYDSDSPYTFSCVSRRRKEYTHYMVNGKVYKKYKEFLKAIEPISCNLIIVKQ